MVGQRLTPDDVVPIAHLVTLGERRTPGVLLRAYEPAALERLAAAVVATATLQPLLSRYAAWDGAEPEPAPEPPDDSGFNPDSGRWNPDRTVVKGQVTGGGGGGDGG